MTVTRSCLVVFTKPARPGFVKTRLVGELTAERAAQLQGAFLEDLLVRMEGASFQTRLAWAVDSDEPLPRSRMEAFRQEGRDLGERLYSGLSRTLAEFDSVAAIGSDHPDLPETVVVEAFEKLGAGKDVVLGPASDGGYYLIGVTRDSLQRELFSDVEWSTDRVLEQTLERCRSLGARVETLGSLDDVDTPDDLRRLAGRLALGSGPSSPNTKSLLSEWGMIPVQGRT
jgi:rSAM/selenodomain-associated transferase 1